MASGETKIRFGLGLAETSAPNLAHAQKSGQITIGRSPAAQLIGFHLWLQQIALDLCGFG